jgi:hypothetical protein
MWSKRLMGLSQCPSKLRALILAVLTFRQPRMEKNVSDFCCVSRNDNSRQQLLRWHVHNKLVLITSVALNTNMTAPEL